LLDYHSVHIEAVKIGYHYFETFQQTQWDITVHKTHTLLIFPLQNCALNSIFPVRFWVWILRFLTRGLNRCIECIYMISYTLYKNSAHNFPASLFYYTVTSLFNAKIPEYWRMHISMCWKLICILHKL